MSPHVFIWGWDQIHFPKHYIFYSVWDNGQSKKPFGTDIVFNSKMFLSLVTHMTRLLQECCYVCCYTSRITIFRWLHWTHKRFFTRWRLDCPSRLVSTLLDRISVISYLYITVLLTLFVFFVFFISYLLPFFFILLSLCFSTLLQVTWK